MWKGKYQMKSYAMQIESEESVGGTGQGCKMLTENGDKKKKKE